MKDWWDWIVSDLSSLFSSRSETNRKNRQKTQVHVSSQGIFVSKRSNSTASVELSELESSKDLARQYSGKCDVRFDRSLGLERQYAPLIMPASKRLKMAQLDLSAFTPLSESEVHVFMPEPTATMSSSMYMAIKKKSLIDSITRLQKLALRPTKILIEGKEATYTAHQSVLASLGLAIKWRSPIPHFNLAICLLVAFGIFGTIGHLYFRQINAWNNMSEELLSVNDKALEARTLHENRKTRLKEIETVRQDRFQRHTLVSVIEELSKRTPDSVWLTSINISDAEIQLSGFAQSAPNLVSSFDKSPMFSNPALTGRVLKNSQIDKDRFSVTMNIVSPSK